MRPLVRVDTVLDHHGIAAGAARNAVRSRSEHTETASNSRAAASSHWCQQRAGAALPLGLVPGAEHVVQVQQLRPAQADPAAPEVQPRLDVGDHHAIPADRRRRSPRRGPDGAAEVPAPSGRARQPAYLGERPDAGVVLVAGEGHHGHVVTRLDEALDLEVLAALPTLTTSIRRLVAVPEHGRHGRPTSSMTARMAAARSSRCRHVGTGYGPASRRGRGDTRIRARKSPPGTIVTWSASSSRKPATGVLTTGPRGREVLVDLDRVEAVGERGDDVRHHEHVGVLQVRRDRGVLAGAEEERTRRR